MYRNAWHGLSFIVRSEGVSSLYAGVLPSLLKDCPYAAIYLLLYTQFKERLTRLAATRRARSDASPFAAANSAVSSSPSAGVSEWHVSGQTPLTQFVSAFCAATVATVAFQPLEVVKTRLQLPSHASSASASPSSFARFTLLTASVYRADGLSGFFAGLLPRVLRRSLSNAIAWSLFEQIYSFWSGTIAI